MKYIKTYENIFEKGDIVYLYNPEICPSLEYGKPYVIKGYDLDFPYSTYYKIGYTDSNYVFPGLFRETLFITEEEYLKKIANKYNL